MALSPEPNSPKIVNDDELLRNAIPIDALEEDDDDDDDDKLEMLEPVVTQAVPPKPKLQKHMGATTAPRATVKPGHKIRVKTFVGKLKQDLGDNVHGPPESITNMDSQINDFLNEHPNLQVKHVTQTVGVLTSKKGDEPTLFVSLWF